MTVQRSAQPLLVKMVTNETDGSTEHEETVQHTDLDVLIGLLWREGTTVTEKVDEADGDATIDVEDKLTEILAWSLNAGIITTHSVLLRGRDLLDSESVVEQAVTGEVLPHVLLHKLDTEIRVVDALDLVADTADCELNVSIV